MNAETSTPTRKFHHCLVFSIIGFAIFLPGCTTVSKVSLTSSVEGTNVSANSAPLGTVGSVAHIVELPPLQKDVSRYEVVFTAPDHFPETVILTADQLKDSAPLVIPQVILAPKTIRKKARINATPDGVDVSLGGQPLGKTDLTSILTFERANKNIPFPVLKLTFKKEDYQSEEIALTVDQYPAKEIDLPVVKLQRLRHVQNYQFKARAQSTGSGALQPISVDLYFDEKLVGKTPETGMALDIEFKRSSKDSKWPSHRVSLTLPDQFKTDTRVIDYDSTHEYEVQMEPVTEFWIEEYSPKIDVPPTGAILRMSVNRSLAMRDTNETAESPSANLTPVTAQRRIEIGYKGKIQFINSFTPTPDGENVIYGLTSRSFDGTTQYSNLMLKGVGDVGSFVTQVTSSERYFYYEPRFGADGKNTLVFTGNAENLNKPDIYRTDLDKGFAINGGITRLTSGSTLYASPTFRDSKERIFFISYESEFAQAKPRLGSVQFDGSLTTMLGIEGQDPKPGPDGTIYFTRRDPVTGKVQLFKAGAGGRQETRLIQDSNFAESNCFDFDLDPKGERLLFVSDRASTAENTDLNIYMIDLRGGVSKAPLQITYNRSKDYAPRWVPSPDSPYANRVFFLSNRGGVANIWYLDLQMKN